MDNPSGARFRLELLGPPRLTECGAERACPSRRALALLACLAIEGRIARSRLAALFWDGMDEPSARRNLRRELARLRDAGLADTFDAQADNLTLAASVDCDWREFEHDSARDDALDAALSAWRGPLLEGFVLADAPQFDRWLDEQRERALRRWRVTATAVATAREARGDARGALAIQQRLIDSDPLQEQPYAEAMRLHYLLGERAAALDLYERCRRLLQAELGLEPLAQTQALAERIRAAERMAPLVQRQSPVSWLALDAPLIGRDAARERLQDSPAAVLLLVGEPGVGKTRLAQECLLARTTVSLRCEAAATGAALHPLAESLRAALEQPALVERLARVDAASRREAARLWPPLDPAARFEPPADRDDAQSARLRLFDALGDVLDALAGPGGNVWIDDLHWADESTLALLDHLAHRHARTPALHPRVVAAARGQELRERAVASNALRALERARLLERVVLAPLSADDTLAWVRALSGTAQGTLFAARLHKATHGNPYHLLETLRFLFDAGELQIDEAGAWITRYDDATADYAELPVPPSVAATVIERVGRLGAAARRVLEVAALAGAGFTLAQVQPATALSEWEAVDGLERALQARLLLAQEPGYRFAHELARDALAAQLGAERRRLVHRRLALTLEADGAAPARVAQHLQAAGDVRASLPWWTAAAQAAETVFAWNEALAHHAAVLAACAPDELEPRIAAHRARCAILRRLHDTPAMLSEADALAALEAQRPELHLADEAQLWRVRAHNLAENFPPARAAGEAVLTHADRLPATLRHELRMAMAQTLHGAGEVAQAVALLDAETALIDQLDARQRLELHLQRASLAMTRGDGALARADAEAASGIAQQLHLVAAQGEAANILAYVMHVGGDTVGALAALEAAQAQAERAALVGVQRSLLTNLVKLHVHLGHAQPARQRMQQAQALFAAHDDPATQARLRSRAVEVAALAGELDEALGAARDAVSLLERIGSAAGTYWPWYQLARLRWQCGDAEAAVAVYRALPQSSAYSALAQPAIDFFGCAFSLAHDTPPAQAEQIAAALAALPAAGEHSHYGAEDHAYWRAAALLRAGRPHEAWVLVRTLSTPPFTLHAAALQAVQLRAAAEAGALRAGWRDEAREGLSKAPPLEAIELLAAMGRACVAEGERVEAARWREAARERAATLATTLRDAIARTRFDARHAALIGP